MTIELNKIHDVSLIVVNFNAGDLLSECIAAALEQVQEVIIVDNASTDDSLTVLQSRFLEQTQLQIIKNNKNLGFSAACNIGARQAKASNLLFLNPDCILSDNAVGILLSELGAQPDIGMAGGLLLNPDGTEQPGARRAVPTPWRSFVRAFNLHRFSDRWPRLFYDFHLHKQPLPDHPVDVEALSGACMLIKREALKEVGFWDEDYFLHCEDLDLCMRFRINGWRIIFVPDAEMTHFAGRCSEKNPVFVEWHKHKGMIHFYRKFFKHQYPGPLMWLVVTGVWLRFFPVAAIKSTRRFFRER